jgi:tape measure domain-containing protein
MSNEIDNKVVRMTFDNAAFQKATEATMSSIEKLKQSLNFSKSTGSMTDISKAAGRVDLSPVSTQVESVNAKFLALSAVAISALTNISSQAIATGTQVLKSLTISPIADGFSEYETNMNSIQTILANTQSKGSTLDDVNSALQELNEYSDKTIYNFAEMAKNIGTFTAAGVDLDTSVGAIKGIANLAAVSGSTSEQASSAMYQLSQALAAGKVGLQDWNSVVNAGMGGEQFKTALFETAKVMGKISDVPLEQSFTEWEDAGNSFRESIGGGNSWIDTDVLTSSLELFTGDLTEAQLKSKGFNDAQVKQFKAMGVTAVEAATKVKTFTQLVSTIKEAMGTGFAETFKLVIGNFEEARALWSGIYKFAEGIIANTAGARNEMLRVWKENKGRELLVQALVFSLRAVEMALRPIKDAFRDVFPARSGESLVFLTKALTDFTQRVKEFMERNAPRLQQVFRAIFSIVKIGLEIFKGVASVVVNLGRVFLTLAGSLKGVTGASGDFITKISKLLVDGGLIAKVFDVINWALLKLAGGILWVRARLSDFFDVFTKGVVAEAFGAIFERLGLVFIRFKGIISALANAVRPALSAIGGFFSSIGSFVSGAGGAAGGGIVNVLTSIADGLLNFINAISGKLVVGSAGAIKKLSEISSAVFAFFANLTVSVGSIRKDIPNVFANVGNAIKTFFTSLVDGFKRVSGGAAEESKGILSSFFEFVSSLGDKLSGAINISKTLSTIGDAIKNFFGTIFGSVKGSAGDVEKTFGSLGERIGEFAANIWTSIKDGFANLGPGLSNIGGAISGFFSSLWESLKNAGGQVAEAIGDFFSNLGSAFSSPNLDTFQKVAATGIFAVLVNSFRKIANEGIKFDFFPGLADVLENLAGAIKTFQNSVRADILLKIAIAMAVLTASIYVLSTMDPKEIGIALGAMATGMASLVGSLALLAKVGAGGKKLIALSISLTLIAIATLVLAAAIKVYSMISWETMRDGLSKLALVLGVLAITAYAFGKGEKGFLKGAFAIIVLSGAIVIFAKAIEYYSKLDLSMLAKGFGIIAGILAGFAIFSNLVDADALQKFGISLGLVTISMWGLIKVVEQFAALSYDELAKGLFGIAAVLAIVLGTMMLMPEENEAKVGTLALLGMSAALWVMAKAIETIGKLKLGQVVQSVLALVTIIGLMVGAAVLLDKFGGEGVGMMLGLAFAIVIFAGALYALGQLDVGQVLIALGAIAGLFLVIGLATLALTPLIPALAALGSALILVGVGFALFGAGVALAGVGLLLLSKVGKKAIDNFLTILDKVVDAIPRFAVTFAKGFLKFVEVVLKGSEKIVDLVGDLLIKILQKIAELAPVVGETIGAIIEALLVLIEEKVPRFIEVALVLITAFLTGIRDNIEQIITLGLEIITNFLQGLINGIPKLGEAIRLLIAVIVDEITKAVPLLINAGANIVISFIDGMASALPRLITAIGDLIVNLIFALGGQAKRIVDAGYATLLSFLWGMTNNFKTLSEEVRKMINQVIKAVDEFLLGDGKGKKGVIDAGINFVKKFLSAMVDRTIGFARYMGDLVIKLLDGLSIAIEERAPEIRRAARRLAVAIIEGITGGLWDRIEDVKNAALDVAKEAVEAVGLGWLVDSPSKVFYGLAQYAGDGIVLGFNDSQRPVKNAARSLADSTVKAFSSAMSSLRYDIDQLDDFNPTIAPVLDLTRVEAEAKSLSRMLKTAPIQAALSYNQAQSIASIQNRSDSSDASDQQTAPTEINFTQNLYSPDPLSSERVYRSTKSQLATAKEKLGIG